MKKPTRSARKPPSAEIEAVEETFRELMPEFLREPKVTEGTGFGSGPGLRVNGKIFAMAVRGALVLKLPRERVTALVDSGHGEHFEAGQGRKMKEWVELRDPELDWPALVREALQFVRASAKR